MLQVIFQHYARDLEAVQVQYEAQKHNPPVPHNVPPTAGNIMWARQLLSRIEEPMQLFAQNKPLMAMKESKKVIKLYNRVRPRQRALEGRHAGHIPWADHSTSTHKLPCSMRETGRHALGSVCMACMWATKLTTPSAQQCN